MDCSMMRGLVALHAGGETTGSERIAVEAHLSTCADCSRDIEGYRSGRSLLAELREGVAPAGSIEGIWARLQPQVAPKPALRFARMEWTLRLAAVLLIGATIGYLFTTGTRPATRDALPGALVDYRHEGRGSREAGTNPAAPTFASPGMNNSFRFLERNVPSTGTHYLPRVERVVASDERSF